MQHTGGAWGLAIAAGASGGGGCRGRAVTAAAFGDKLGVVGEGGHARQLLQADCCSVLPAWHGQQGARGGLEWSSVVCCYEAKGTSAATQAWALVPLSRAGQRSLLSAALLSFHLLKFLTTNFV